MRVIVIDKNHPLASKEGTMIDRFLHGKSLLYRVQVEGEVVLMVGSQIMIPEQKRPKVTLSVGQMKTLQDFGMEAIINANDSEIQIMKGGA